MYRVFGYLAGGKEGKRDREIEQKQRRNERGTTGQKQEGKSAEKLPAVDNKI